MRIGIDARFYGTAGRGLGRYVSELIAHLEDIDRENEYWIFLRQENFGQYVPTNPRFHKVLAEMPWYGWREQLFFPRLLKSYQLDVVHFTHFNVPLLYNRPFVVTIHDLILMTFPTQRMTTLAPIYFGLKRLAYRLVITSALRRARRVITVSEHSKAEIVKYFPFMAKRDITVTYEACSPNLRGNVAAATPRVNDLPHPYFLYVGNAYPHKNLDWLVAAFQSYRRSNHDDRHLVLVGSQDYFGERLRREAEEAGRSENVVFFGMATDAELAALYDGATAYVFPSLCEGFGLPPLEAMCRGVPVVSSKESCLPEVLGEAVLYFDPRDPNSLAAALRQVENDADLRQSLVIKGREQASRYDWKSCAQATAKAYADAARQQR
ncbi:MAG: glycosyltransferase family 1 protein [Patescibacteria group bacterium]|nr:glycosyltransferase family 1 protein [Patescibacteria group bacterium]